MSYVRMVEGSAKAVNKTYNEISLNERWREYRTPEYHEYRRKWESNPPNHIVEKFPLHVDLEITTYCNLLCTMCPRTVQLQNGEFDKSKHLDFEVFKRLIDEGANNGLCSVKFNYEGEPLMHPNVVEMVKYCKDKGIIDVMFNTNGVLLNEDMAAKLLEAGLDNIFISFDSPYKEKYEEIRVGAKYDKVIENVRRFVEIRNSNEAYWKTKVRVSKVLFPEETEADLETYIKLWEPIADAIGFSSLMDVEGKAEIPFNPNFCCDQPWQRLFVGVDGIAFPCCRDYNRQYPVGDVSKDSLTDMWTNDAYKKLREAHENGKYNEINICKNCTYVSNKPVRIEFGNK